MIEQQLIERYTERLTKVFKEPNPYYEKPLYEFTEIKNWIEKLKKINK